jgi:diguanylate cyclase (GGDEF)-like protein
VEGGVPDVDFVTGLASRATFEALLGRACVRDQDPAGETQAGDLQGSDVLAAVICDVAGLKEVNQRNGFAAGDACLRSAADRLRTAARGATLTARLGGDELIAVFLGRDAAALARDAALALVTPGTPPLRAASGARRPSEMPGPFVDRLYASLRLS